MTLFQILTRKLATGKIKATRKLLDRLHREAGGKRPPKPSKARGRKPPGFARLCLGRACGSMDAGDLPLQRTGGHSRPTW